MSQVIYIFGEFFTSTAVSNPDLAPEYPGGGATEVASRLAKQCHGAGSGDMFWFPEMGVFKWMVYFMEKPIKIDDVMGLWGYHPF
jgi:hypothetical protein